MYRRAQLGIASREVGSVSLRAHPPVARRRVVEPTRARQPQKLSRALSVRRKGVREEGGGENDKDLKDADTTDRSDYALLFRTTTRSYYWSDDRGDKLYLARKYSR